MEQHFVTFYSPGTLLSEQTRKPIEKWDTDVAIEMSKTINERHWWATPYGFRFTTRGRGPDDLDSKEIDRSGMYFLGGRVETLEQVRQRADPAEQILLSNMESNGWARIVVDAGRSWGMKQPLQKGDMVLVV